MSITVNVQCLELCSPGRETPLESFKTASKLLAVATMAAATLLFVSAVSAGLVNLQCQYIENNGAVWCTGQSDGAEPQPGLWIGTYIIPMNAIQQRIISYGWDGYQWVYRTTHDYAIIGGLPTTVTAWAAYVACVISPQSCGSPSP